MTRIIIFFQWKMHLIKVLGLGSSITDLRIWPLKSKSVIVKLFLSSSRTSPQNLSRNGWRSIIQMTSQSSWDSPQSASLLLYRYFFFNHQLLKPSPRPNEVIPFVLTTNSSRPTIQLFDLLFFFFYLFSFAYFLFPNSLFFYNTI